MGNNNKTIQVISNVWILSQEIMHEMHLMHEPRGSRALLEAMLVGITGALDNQQMMCNWGRAM